MHTPVNTAVRAVVRSPGKAAPLEVLRLRVGTFTFLYVRVENIQYLMIS